jgi:hypothetical protein
MYPIFGGGRKKKEENKRIHLIEENDKNKGPESILLFMMLMQSRHRISHVNRTSQQGKRIGTGNLRHFASTCCLSRSLFSLCPLHQNMENRVHVLSRTPIIPVVVHLLLMLCDYDQ